MCRAAEVLTSARCRPAPGHPVVETGEGVGVKRNGELFGGPKTPERHMKFGLSPARSCRQTGPTALVVA